MTGVDGRHLACPMSNSLPGAFLVLDTGLDLAVGYNLAE